MEILVVLWLAWAFLLFGGFILGHTNAEGTRRMPTWTRMASSVTLVMAAWLLVLSANSSNDSNSETQASRVIFFAIGMTLGCIGDFFMAGLIPVKQNVLGGMVSFGLGHIAYIIGLLSIENDKMLSPQPVIIVIWLIIAAILWYLVVFRGSEKTTLHYAALPYSLLLAATAGIAMMRALQASGFIPFAIGAALFLLSDLILATRLFNHTRFRLIDDVIWLTYGPAQMLMIYGIVIYALHEFYLDWAAVINS